MLVMVCVLFSVAQYTVLPWKVAMHDALTHVQVAKSMVTLFGCLFSCRGHLTCNHMVVNHASLASAVATVIERCH